MHAAALDDFELLGELGRNSNGEVVWLGRERQTGQVVALSAEADAGVTDRAVRVAVRRDLGAGVPAGERECFGCGNRIRDWRRYCERCGSDLGGATGTEDETMRADLNGLLAEAARQNLDVLGQMKRTDGGGAVYFARDRDSREIVALSPRRAATPAAASAYALDRTSFSGQRAAGVPSDEVSPSTRSGAGEPATGTPPSGITAVGAGESDVASPPPSTVADGERVCPACGRLFSADFRFCSVDGSALSPVERDDDLVGHIIADRYHVVRKLGQGGMAQVYLAEHVRMGRHCALKLLNRVSPEHADLTRRFTREAANASRITHPNVATIYDFGETGDGIVYLAMEYVDGEPLSGLIQRHGKLPLARARDIAVGIAAGLAAAHRQNVVHRDLKPDNILIGRDDEGRDVVKVVDFGIAKALGAVGSDLTQTGFVVGTPKYMSPEQLIADPVDVRTDIYSLGCVLFEMLTGAPALGEGEGAFALTRRLTEPAPDPRTRDPDIPRALADVVRTALARLPGERYQTAAAFREALRRIPIEAGATVRAAATVPSISRPEAAEEQSGRPAVPAGATPSSWSRSLRWPAGAGLVVVAGAVAWALRPGPASVPPVAVADLVLRDAATGAVAPAELALLVGDTVRFTAIAIDATGNSVADRVIAWQSSDPSIASVDVDGSVAVLAAGTVLLSANVAGVVRNITVRGTAPAAELPVAAMPPPGPAAPARAPAPAAIPEPPRAPPTDGTLQLIVNPWANIVMNGTLRRSEVVREVLRLAPGRHRLRLENPNMLPVDTTFEIRSGQTTTLRIQMTPRSP